MSGQQVVSHSAMKEGLSNLLPPIMVGDEKDRLFCFRQSTAPRRPIGYPISIQPGLRKQFTICLLDKTFQVTNHTLAQITKNTAFAYAKTTIRDQSDGYALNHILKIIYVCF